MLDTLFTLDPLFWIVVGTFVGWNLPQPSWAKKIQNKVQSIITKKYNQIKK